MRINGKNICKVCGQRGHNSRRHKVQGVESAEKTEKKEEVKKETYVNKRCSYCRTHGHTKATCQSYKKEILETTSLTTEYVQFVGKRLNDKNLKPGSLVTNTFRTSNGSYSFNYDINLIDELLKNPEIKGISEKDRERFYILKEKCSNNKILYTTCNIDLTFLVLSSLENSIDISHHNHSTTVNFPKIICCGLEVHCDYDDAEVNEFIQLLFSLEAQLIRVSKEGREKYWYLTGGIINFLKNESDCSIEISKSDMTVAESDSERVSITYRPERSLESFQNWLSRQGKRPSDARNLRRRIRNICNWLNKSMGREVKNYWDD